MLRLRSAAVILSAVAMIAAVGLATPAYAEVREAPCQTNYPPKPPSPYTWTFKFTGTVYYTPSGATDQITALGFRVHGAHTGGKSDVAYTVRENGTTLLSGHTPDNLGHDETRIIPVSVGVATAAVGQVDFYTAFDLAGYDPHCTATTTW